MSSASAHVSLSLWFLLGASSGSSCSSEQPAAAKNGASKAVESKKSAPEKLPEGDAPAGDDDDGPIVFSAGEFWMGAESPGKTHAPKHQVTLDAFELDRYEVTAEEYAACVAKGSCTKARTGGACTAENAKKADHPINCVTFEQARAYCEFAGRRLPTEAEWERAARGTDARTYPWGEAWPPPKDSGNFSDESARAAVAYWSAVAEYNDGFVETAPAGNYDGSSGGGASDMAGNVMEWVADYWSDKITKHAAKNPKGPATGTERVVRGSSYGHYRKVELSATFRAGYREDVTSEHIGFRCAK